MLAVTDERISDACRYSLEKIGYSTVALPPFHLLAEPVGCHPDMLIFIINNTLITHKLYYDIARKQIDRILEAADLRLVLSREKIGSLYPRDVLFNAAVVGNKVICNLNFVSEHIKEQANICGMELIHINQGYAKCSICPVSDNAVITADNSVFEAAEKSGIDALKITEGSIGLKGYNYGFIGGASGEDRENVYFCGDLEKHPDAIKIKEFCQKHKKRAVSLSEEKLYDFGTVILIDNRKK